MIQAPASKMYLKILAFCAAVVLWFIVITVENHVSVLPDQVTVKVENLEKGLSLGGAVQKVRLFLGVDKGAAMALSPSDFDVVADLADLGAGEHTVRLTARSKSDNVQVLKIEPSELHLKLSPAIEKEAEVRVKVKGEPAAENVVESTRSEVDKVKIRGAQSVIDKVSWVEAELVLDGTQREVTSQTVSLKIPPEANVERNLLMIEPEQILVTAVISSKLKTKEVAVEAGFNSEDERTAWEKRISLTPQKVTIQGLEKDLSAITSVLTEPFEITLLNRNGSVAAGLDLPEGMSSVPEDQKINISMTLNTVEKSIDVPVTVKVNGRTVDVTVSPPTVRVTLSGPRDAIDSLIDGDVIAVIKRDAAVTSDQGAELFESDISVPVGLNVMTYGPHNFMLLPPDTI